VAHTLAEPLEAILRGKLPVRVRGWDGSEVGPSGAPAVVLTSRRALRHLLWSPGELGLARAYVSGDLDVDGDLEDGFRRVAQFAREQAARGRARPRLDARNLLHGLVALVRLGAVGPRPRVPASEARLHGRRHTRARDSDVIAHHYDLSNEFYELILDETMAYSCAYWTTDAPDAPLADAQRAKLDLVCRKLELEPGMRLLDVGCGWGSLTLHAARHFGARVTGVTLSRQQHDFVAKRVAELGLSDQVELRLCDYRDLAGGPYDAAASIEMGEHVGDEHYPLFVARLHQLLRPGGRLLIQQMSRGPGLPGGGPFIEAYIAADMHMRPVGETVTLIESGGFEVRGVEAMRELYARTGRAWRATLEQRWPEVVDLVGEEVARVWRLYLVGGALTFEEGRMGVDQILATRGAST
jgi:cyclopropane-fatty-acyl-phospholipid synthase